MTKLPQWKTLDGVPVLFYEKHDTPLVTIILALAVGGYHDPKDKVGVVTFMGDMLARGTKNRTREQIENELDFMGATMRVETGYHSTLVTVQVLRRNLEKVQELLLDILTNPIFPEPEIAKLREETIAKLNLRLEDDQQIARVRFMDVLYGAHPYGRDLTGTVASLKKINREELVSTYGKYFHRGNLMITAAGDLKPAEFDATARQILTAMPAGKSETVVIPFQRSLQGRHIVLIDKPERTQTQFFIGQPGIAASSPDQFPLAVFLTAFAGHMFQAQYLQEIRVKRGWAYGAYGSMDGRRDGGIIYLYTYPAVKDTLPALKLSLDLIKKAVDKGITDEQLNFAKTYLTRSYPFMVDLPEKVVAQKIQNRYFGRADDYLETYVEKITAVTNAQARAAAKKYLNAEDVQIVLLCTAKDFKDKIAKELGAKSVETIPYDRL